MWIEILAGLFLVYCFIVAIGLTCFRHTWEKQGPTYHMAIDTKPGELDGWLRNWWVCSRCGKTKKAEKIENEKVYTN